jgi:hypothetical protein
MQNNSNQGYYNSWQQSSQINSAKIDLLILEVQQLTNQIKEIQNNKFIQNHVNHPTYSNYLHHNYPNVIDNDMVYGESDGANEYHPYNESDYSTVTYHEVPILENIDISEAVYSETSAKSISIKTLREISELCKSSNDELCAICKASIDKNDIIRKLNCNHSYHPDCIDEWFDENINCPTCMKEFI